MGLFDGLIFLKLIAVLVLYLFLPLNAISYYFFRRSSRMVEIERILEVLLLDPRYELGYRKSILDEFSGFHIFYSVVYSSVLSIVGLAMVFLGSELFPLGEFPAIELGVNVFFPAHGSRFIWCMAFLGAYVWGLENIYRRSGRKDLRPRIYDTLSLRIIFVPLVAMLLYNTYTALATTEALEPSALGKAWPLLAFLIGMFPQRAINWVTEQLLMNKIPGYFQSSPIRHLTVREAPLEMIEGIKEMDIERLEEVDIESCYDMAAADPIQILLYTPFNPQQLIDWILQLIFKGLWSDKINFNYL